MERRCDHKFDFQNKKKDLDLKIIVSENSPDALSQFFYTTIAK